MLRVFFYRFLDVAASEVIYSASVSVSVLGLVFVKFNVFFRDDSPTLTLACTDARDTIYLKFHVLVIG